MIVSDNAEYGILVLAVEGEPNRDATQRFITL